MAKGLKARARLARHCKLIAALERGAGDERMTAETRRECARVAHNLRAVHHVVVAAADREAAEAKCAGES